MLIKMTGEQVSKYWIDNIKPAIAMSLPDYVTIAEDSMNKILAQILSDALHCWAVMSEGEFVGICTTMVTEDIITESKAYLIYSLYNFTDKEYPEQLWFDCLSQVKSIAKNYGCDKVYCFTDNEQIIKRAEQTGGVTKQQLFTF